MARLDGYAEGKITKDAIIVFLSKSLG